MTHEQLYEQAVKKYYKQVGNDAQQPNAAMSQVEIHQYAGIGGLLVGTVVLTNVNGRLARYELAPAKKLLRRWPKTLENQ